MSCFVRNLQVTGVVLFVDLYRALWSSAGKERGSGWENLDEFDSFRQTERQQDLLLMYEVY